MTSYDLILRLIEMLLAEKEINNQLREDKKNDEDQKHTQSRVWNKIAVYSCSFILA